MEQLTQPIADVLAVTGNGATDASKLLQHAQSAVRRLDLAECMQIATSANENPQPAAGPALCALLQRPRSLKGRNAWRKEPWVEMRVAAIQALRLIEDKFAAPSLANVLIHDVPPVRIESARTLRAMGSHAVIPLVDTIRAGSDWPLEGMLEAIDTLGAIEDKNAGPTLARMLFGLLPGTPSRWLRTHIKWSAIVGAFLTLAGAFAMGRDMDSVEPGLALLLGVIIMGIMMFCGFTCVSALAVGVFIRKAKSMEANKIYGAASNALISIKDPRSVPSLIEVATEKYPARYAAIRALRDLLPVLSMDDYGLLSGAVERRLTGMFALNDPLVLAAVRSLEFVGTGQSVGPVERLSRRRLAAHHSYIEGQIRSEAERVLPVLVERRRMEEASSVLLRPSQVAPDTGAVLLRPASSLSSYEEHVEQLLRPGQAD